VSTVQLYSASSCFVFIFAVSAMTELPGTLRL